MKATILVPQLGEGMAKRKSTKEDPCPVARALDVIGDRWSLFIVRDAFDGMRRFGELQRSLGVARNILSDRLHKLVENGILEAVPASDGTSYQEYVLTPRGASLFPIVVALRQWGEDQLFIDGEPHSTLVERASGAVVAKMDPLGSNGLALTPADTVVKKLPAETAANGSSS